MDSFSNLTDIMDRINDVSISNENQLRINNENLKRMDESLDGTLNEMKKRKKKRFMKWAVVGLGIILTGIICLCLFL